jgi:hypothetical protein
MIDGLLNESLKRNYGVIEINPVTPGYHEEEYEDITWEELKGKKGVKADRLRFVSDPGFPFWDCSYFFVRIDGVKYRVSGHPFEQLPKRGLKTKIYNTLKEDNVFIDGIFKYISTIN